MFTKVLPDYRLQLPQELVERYSIRPGDEVELDPADDGIRLIPTPSATGLMGKADRLSAFDRETSRLSSGRPSPAQTDRGWVRADLYGDHPAD